MIQRLVFVIQWRDVAVLQRFEVDPGANDFAGGREGLMLRNGLLVLTFQWFEVNARNGYFSEGFSIDGVSVRRNVDVFQFRNRNWTFDCNMVDFVVWPVSELLEIKHHAQL